MHPRARQRDKEVCHGEVDDVEVGGSPHSLVSVHDDDDEGVAEQRKGDDHQVQNGLDGDLQRRQRLQNLRVRYVFVVVVVETRMGCV